MIEGRLYFDDNASAPPRATAVDAAQKAIALGGNPSSVHGEGRSARRIVNEAREAVARLFGADAANVIFTSGATEANATALDPGVTFEGRKVTHCLVSAIEHASVLAGGRFGAEAIIPIPVDADGRVLPEAVAALLSRLGPPAVPLVSVMAANNETGVVQPIGEIADVVHAAGGVLHSDAVQAAGRIDAAKALAGADLVSVSGHKIGAPCGVGALIVMNDAVQLSGPLIGGGGQERNRRGGTENVPGIAGFGVAAREAAEEKSRWDEISVLRSWIESRLRTISPDVRIFGEGAPRLPNTICVARPGLLSETAVIAFDLKGMAISSGSACSSGKVGSSHVLRAMGYDEADGGALRISLPRTATRADAERFIAAWKEICGTVADKRTAA